MAIISQDELRTKATMDVDDFNRGADSASKSANKFDKSIKSTDKSVIKAEQNTKKYLSTLKSLAVGVGQAKFALQNLYSVTGGVVQKVIEANSGIEKTTALLKSMSKTGTKMEALDDFRYLIDLSTKAPFSIEALSDALVKFKSVGIEPARDGVSALANAVAAFGGSDETLKRASIAIQQMGGKGVISMEELRQQLGEAVPTAISLMARSLNMTYAELVKKISLGQVEAKGAIAAMLSEMEKSFGGASEAMMLNWEGMTKKMKTNWLLFLKEVGDSGVMATAKEGLKEFTNFLVSPEGVEMARQLGTFLTGTMKAAATLVKILYELKDVILIIGQIIATKFIFSKFMSLKDYIVNSVIAFKGFKNTLDLTSVSFQKVSSKAGQFATSLGANKKALRLLDISLGSTMTFLSRFSMLLSTLGGAIVIVGLETIYSWLMKIAQTGERAADAVKKFKDEAGRPIPTDIKDIESRIKQIKVRLLANEEQKAAGDKGISLFKVSLYDEVELKKELRELETALPVMKNALEKQLSVDIFKEQFANLFEEEQKISKQYNELQINLEKDRTRAIGLTEEERKKLGLTEEELNKRSLANQDEWIKKNQMLIESMRLESLILMQQGKITSEAYGRIVSEIDNYNSSLTKKIELMKQSQYLQKEENAIQIADPKEKKLANDFYNAQIASLKLEGKTAADAQEEARKRTNQRSLDLNKLYEKQKDRNAAWIAGTSALQGLNAKEKEHDKVVNQQNTSLQNVKDKYTKLIEANQLLNLEYQNSNENVEKFIINDKAQIALMVQKAGNTKEAIEIQRKYNDALADNQALTWVSKLPELLKESQTETIKTTKESQLALNEFNRNQALMTIEAANIFKQNEEVKRKAIKDTNTVFDNYAKGIEIKNKTAFEKMLEEWSSAEYTFSDGMKKAFESASDAIMEFVETGKVSMNDLFKSIMLDMVRLSMQKNILAPLGDALNNIANSLGKSISASGGLGGFFSSITGSLFHTGGVVGSNSGATRAVSPMTFIGAPKFHNGGFPGLKQDEVPAILQKGEVVLTKDQMASSGNVGNNVQVNVINQTSQDVVAESGQPRFDGSQMILDVVLRAMNRPGSFRDGMRGAI